MIKHKKHEQVHNFFGKSNYLCVKLVNLTCHAKTHQVHDKQQDQYTNILKNGFEV